MVGGSRVLQPLDEAVEDFAVGGHEPSVDEDLAVSVDLQDYVLLVGREKANTARSTVLRIWVALITRSKARSEVHVATVAPADRADGR